MNLFRRVAATFSGSIESAVSHLENQEAVVQAALKSARSNLAKSQVRLERVKRDGHQIEAKLQQLHAEETSWERRAKELAGKDQEQALECVRRRNLCVESISQFEKAQSAHLAQESSLVATTEKVRARILEIENAKNMLRTRESAALAQRSAGRLESSTSDDLDNILERWEMKVLEVEFEDQIIAPIDSFEVELNNSESTAELKNQLDELLRSDKS